MEPNRRRQLAEAVTLARAEAQRLDLQSRALLVGSIAGLTIVSVRGIVALIAPSDVARGWPLAGALLVAVTVLVALHVRGLRVRLQREALLDHVRFVELSRDIVDQSSDRPVIVLEEPRAPQVTLGAGSIARRLGTAVAVAMAVGVLLAWVSARAPQPIAKRWTFVESGDDAPAQLGLRSHVDDSGPWALEDDAHATGARALVNREGEAGARPGIVTANDLSARDLRVTTRCKAAASKQARACGLVFRFRDVDNHHVARVDVATNELVVTVVTGGVERVLGRLPIGATPDVWQEIAVEASGRRVRVTWNGTSTLEVVDAGATKGGVGIWSPAEGEASFDDLSVGG